MTESIIQLPRKSFYSGKDKILHCGHNAGFFSILTVTLWDLIYLYRQGIIPENINFSNTFINFKNEEQIKNKIDVYPYYFQQEITKKIEIVQAKIFRQDHHGLYLNYNFNVYNLFINKYFNLSNLVLEIENKLIEKYKINFSKTIAICYRGTDKEKEVKLATPTAYLEKAEKILNKNSNFKILIQTDQKQVRDLFVNYFQEKCFFFEEMPVTENKTVLHNQNQETLRISKFEFGLRVLAVTHLISKCFFVVNHTGNMASWICLFRGNPDGVFQFDNQGRLINYWDKVYWNIFDKLRKNQKVNRLVKKLRLPWR